MRMERVVLNLTRRSNPLDTTKDMLKDHEKVKARNAADQEKARVATEEELRQAEEARRNQRAQDVVAANKVLADNDLRDAEDKAAVDGSLNPLSMANALFALNEYGSLNAAHRAALVKADKENNGNVDLVDVADELHTNALCNQ